MHIHLSFKLVAAVVLPALISNAGLRELTDSPRELTDEMTLELITFVRGRASRPRSPVKLQRIKDDNPGEYSMYTIPEGWKSPSAIEPTPANAMTREDGLEIMILKQLQSHGVLLDHGEDSSGRKWAVLRYLDENGLYAPPSDDTYYQY